MAATKTPTMTDQVLVLEAMKAVRAILGSYVEPGPRDCEEAVSRILKIVDREDIVNAVDRLDRRQPVSIAPE